MSRFVVFSLAGALMLGGAWATAAAPAPQVDFELATEKGFPATSAQKWYQVFAELKVSGMQIRTQKSGDQPDIERRGGERSSQYHVVGMLTANGTLILPGGQFSVADKAGLGKWLRELGENGIEGITVKKAAFGLTPTQLEAVHDDLKRPLEFSTKGQSPGAVIGMIRKSLKYPLTADAALGGLFGADDKVTEELQGLSSGTAIAIVLRPAGAVLQPQKPAGGELQYRAVKAAKDVEGWPVGWAAEVEARKAVPGLFDFLNVEFEGVALADVLDAIGGRLKAPMVIDHNSLAAQEIDLTKATVSFPSKRTFYGKVLGDVLFKQKLKYELRLDEADKPFFWITTLKKQP